MLLREIVADYGVDYAKHINTMWGLEWLKGLICLSFWSWT